MSNFLTLTKVFFLSGFNVNRKKKNQSTSLKTFALFGLLFLGISFIYNAMYFFQAVENGLEPSSYLLIVLIIDAMLVFVTSLLQMQRSIFKTKDYEFLESIPVSKFTIVAAKFMAVYLIGLYEDVIITLPALIFFFINGGSVYIGSLVLISTIFVAIIPLLIGSLIGALISIVAARSKHQNVITIIGYVIFLGAIMGVSLTLSSGSATGFDPLVLTNTLPYFKLLYSSFDPAKFHFFIIFVLIHVVSFALTILFMAKIYQPINAYLGNYKRHEEYEVGKDTASLSIDKMLDKKERRMLFGNSQYVLNSMAGYFAYLVIAVMFMFIPVMFKGESSTPEEIEETEFLFYIFYAMIPMFGMLMNSISSTSTVSFSLEGRTNLELLHSYPIHPLQVIRAKLKLALTVSISASLLVGVISSIVMMVVSSFNLQYLPFAFQIIVLPTLASVLVSYVGMLCNLTWVKLDYENEMQVVKNSASVNFTMLFVALPTLFIGGGLITLNIIINPYIPLAIFTVVYAVLIFIMHSIIKNSGVSMYNKLLNK